MTRSFAVLGLLCCLLLLSLSSSTYAAEQSLTFDSSFLPSMADQPPASLLTSVNQPDEEAPLFLPSAPLASVLTLHNLFSSNMVLQRDTLAAMWGVGVPGSTVTIALDDVLLASTTVDGDGDWRTNLTTQSARLSCTLTVSDGTTTVTLSNVAFGDVYLCSGQSNMQFSLREAFGGVDKAAEWATYPYLRLFTIPSQSSSTPLNQSRIQGGWLLSTAAVDGAFSAACFYTGSEVYDALQGKVPIGLVAASYGGTCAEAWTSMEMTVVANARCGPYPIVGTYNNQAYNNESVLFNAMIYPFVQMRLTAVLWYQGESNWLDLDRYKCAFPLMIEDWRVHFRVRDLPFFFVLLHPYASGGGALPPLRIAQLSGLTVPRTAVANGIDLGDPRAPSGDIHPRNKSYVGHRLALHVRKQVYGEVQLVTDGPRITGMTATLVGGVVRLQVTYEGGPTSSGLGAMSTPNCSYAAGNVNYGPCCAVRRDGSVNGVLVAQVFGQGTAMAVNPDVLIDPNRRMVTANITFATPPTIGQVLNVSFAHSPYPGCVLYNDALLPALPVNEPVVVAGAAPFRLHNMHSSNMILQRGEKVVVWGWGEPGATVTVMVDGVMGGSAVVSAGSDWQVELPAHDAATNTTLTFSDGTSTITLTNVAWGDVYYCGGQSNMQVSLNMSFGAADEVAVSSSYPQIRLFSIPMQASLTPLNESLIAYQQGWVLPSPSTVYAYSPSQNNVWYGYFSAVCWYAGRSIFDSVNAGKPADQVIPIGLFQGAYAGSAIVPWTSPDNVLACGANPPAQGIPNQPSALYNAMFFPLLRFRFAALLFYQGESNTGNPTRYACAFPNLIRDWRAKLNAPNLPFYFVLLAPYANTGTGLPDTRVAQQAALPCSASDCLTNTGVSNALDLGDRGSTMGDLHPRNKSFVGKRLALLVQQGVYKQQVVAQGPSIGRPDNAAAVTATIADSRPLTVTVQLPSDATSEGLFVMQTPDCTLCCSNSSSGLLMVRLVNATTNATVSVYPSTVSIDTSARRVTAEVATTLPLKVGDRVRVLLQAEAWPQCALYNRAMLPALPFDLTVGITAPGDDGGDGGSSGSTTAYVAIVVVILIAVLALGAFAVMKWRQRRASSTDEASAAGYNNMKDEPFLAGDKDSSSSGNTRR